MNTFIGRIEHNNNDKDIYRRAADVLKSGGLVAFPTETVYGLGGNALDSEASAKIYSAKGRPSDNPLIVHIAKLEDLYQLSSEVTDSAIRLAEAYWPGPLTMILKKSDIVPMSITGGLDTVAIRMPSHPVARELIEESGVYIAAPSANISGKPSPTLGSHVIHDMQGRIDMIIVDDTVDIGVESTIVDLTDEVPVILRPGFITLEQIARVLGDARMDPGIMESVAAGVVPKAPGMKYKHYAPNATVSIVRGEINNVVAYINAVCGDHRSSGRRVAVMASTETAHMYTCDYVVDMGSRLNEAEAARKLFAVLREFDEKNVDYVYSESFAMDNVGQAVMNRLIKAAGHTIIDV